jgi:hypothetical protein
VRGESIYYLLLIIWVRSIKLAWGFAQDDSVKYYGECAARQGNPRRCRGLTGGRGAKRVDIWGRLGYKGRMLPGRYVLSVLIIMLGATPVKEETNNEE